MALNPYCQEDEVRSALGVNDIELTDAVLDLPVYSMGLKRELNKLSTSLPAAFSTIDLKLVTDRTSQETDLWEGVRLFSVYAVARQVGVSLAGLMPKSVGDGKASIDRFAASPYEDVMERVEQWYSEARSNLSALVASYFSTVPELLSSVPATVFNKVQRSYDPVTGS